MMRRLGAIVTALLLAAASAGAQRPSGLPTRQNQQAPLDRPQDRQALEQRVRQRMWQLAKRRVGLSDEQMRKLVPVNQRFERDRREIMRAERDERVALRQALVDSTHVDQQAIGGHLDRLMQLEHQRLDLVDREQKELSQFMTPLQRARFFALQEQLRRRVQQLQQQRRAGQG